MMSFAARLVGLVTALVMSAQGTEVEDKIERGRESFKFYCAPCHGLEGRGDGPAAKSLKNPPADVTRLTKKDQPFPALRVYAVIDGTRSLPAHGSREMPIWGPYFRQKMGKAGEVELENLIQFIASIQVKPER
jgi:mono/diheme cytochrome c family protein